MTLFYKITNNLTPQYTKDSIPTPHQSKYALRNHDTVGRIGARTEKFQSSFYPDCISEWNTLDPEIRNAPSVAAFKHKLLLKIRPPVRYIFGIHDPIGVSYLSQIRVGLSKLNLHKFKHNFKDTIYPLCPTNDAVEDAEHFFLLCPSYYNYRRDLLARISVVLQPFVQVSTLSNKLLLQLLLYGDKDLPSDINKHQKILGELDLKIRDINIQNVKETKYLDLQIDRHLTGKKHVDKISRKVSRTL